MKGGGATPDKIKLLATYHGVSPAAVVETSDNIDLLSVRAKFLEHSSIPIDKVKVLAPPYIKRGDYISKVSPDYYMHDADAYDVFIIKVTGAFGECEQLFNIIQKAHDSGKKIIVVTDNLGKLDQLIRKTMEGDCYRGLKERLTDRIRNMFLEDILASTTSDKTTEATTIQSSSRSATFFALRTDSATKKDTMGNPAYCGVKRGFLLKLRGMGL